MVQISEAPPFEPGFVWDFRESNGELTLYVSYIDPQRGGFFKPGYHKLSESQDFIKPLYEEVIGLNISLCFDGPIGFDGTTYSIHRRSGFCETKIVWWEDGPKEWRSFTKEVLDVIGKLKSVTNQYT